MGACPRLEIVSRYSDSTVPGQREILLVMGDKFTEEIMEVRVKLMTSKDKVLKDLLEQFGETAKATDRLGLALEVDKLFMSEMKDQSAATSLIAFKHALEEDTKQVKIESSDGTTNSSTKTDQVSSSTVKFHKDVKISGAD